MGHTAYLYVTHPPSTNVKKVCKIYIMHPFSFFPFFVVAELTKEAMSTTTDASAQFSLKLQYEALLKQPLIMKRRQEVNLMKAESAEIQSPPPWTTNKSRADRDQRQTLNFDFNNPLPLSTDNSATASKVSSATPSSNGHSQGEEDEEKHFSLEGVYHSLEETRPLLECLREHSVTDGDSSKYFAGQLLDNLPPVASQLTSGAPPSGAVIGRKMPKNDEVVIEELQVQNKELCQHIVRLLRNMEHCEQENTQLKTKVQVLEQELETIKSRSNSAATSADASLREELDVPFSLMTVEGVGSVSLAPLSAVTTPPPMEIPPLPPLELPDFDV